LTEITAFSASTAEEPNCSSTLECTGLK